MTRRLRLALASILAVAALGAIAPAANAYIYWSSTATGASIGRVNLNGLGATSFLGPTDLQSVADIAVDSRYIYWANEDGRAIGRAKLDGTAVQPRFIDDEVTFQPLGITVTATHIYWTNPSSGARSIGRANIDGTGADENFISGASSPMDVAVEGDHIYWSNFTNNTIGRANLDGSGIDQSFISGATGPYGIAAGSGALYWTNAQANWIGQDTLSTGIVNQSIVSNQNYPLGVAAHSGVLYWTNYFGGTVGRSNLDGSAADGLFVSVPGSYPRGIAVDSLPIPIVSLAGKPTKRSLRVRLSCGDDQGCTLRIVGTAIGSGAPLIPKVVTLNEGQTMTYVLPYSARLRKVAARGARIEVTVTNLVSNGQETLIARVAK